MHAIHVRLQPVVAKSAAVILADAALLQLVVAKSAAAILADVALVQAAAVKSLHAIQAVVAEAVVAVGCWPSCSSDAAAAVTPDATPLADVHRLLHAAPATVQLP